MDQFSLKRILPLILLLFSKYSSAQFFETPLELNSKTYSEGLKYLDSKIENQTDWSAKQIEYILLKANWYNRNWDYELARETIESIPENKILSPKSNAIYCLVKGINEKFLNSPENANKYFDLARSQFAAINDSVGVLTTDIERGEFFRKYNQYEIGIEILDSALNNLALNSGLIYEQVKAHALNRKAAIYSQNGKTYESIEISKNNLNRIRKVQNKYLEASTYNELGYLHKNLPENRMQNIDSSIYYYIKAEKIYRALGLSIQAIEIKKNWVTVYSHNRMHPNKVIRWYNEIISEVKTKNVDFSLRDIYLNLHTEYVVKNQADSALKYFILFHEQDVRDSEKLRIRELEKIKDSYQAMKYKNQNEMIIRDNEIKQNEIANQNRRIRWFIIAISVLIFLLISIYYISRQKAKLSKELLIKNQEKDVLIQEVHHRVKNNLQFINTLLEMQQSSRNDMNESLALKDANLRIASMSLLHEMLYRDHNRDTLNLNKYCLDLIAVLSDGFNIQEGEIDMKIEVEEIALSSDKTSSIGLIINEFFNNSVKHAFFKTDQPYFQLEIYLNPNQENKELLINLKDNGPGLNKTENLNSGFGVKLINLLIQQLRGQGEWSTEKHMSLKITIPL